jgi:hypothetical protein
MGRRRAVLFAAIALCATLAAAPAEAAFPGENGKIAFVRTGADGRSYIWLMENDGSPPPRMRSWCA